MAFDETIARMLLRALLDRAEGQVGEFVECAGVLADVQGHEVTTASTLEELTRRRWIHVKGDRMAATRWGLEFAMDRTDVGRLLRAILKLAGPLGVGRGVPWEAAKAEAGLGELEMHKLINQLRVLGLASDSIQELPQGGHISAVYVSRLGWEYLQHQST